MPDHPEQDMIETIIIGDLAGIDESNWQQYSDAVKQLSDDGKIELDRQRKEVYADVDRQEKMYYVLHNMPTNATRQ
jgi:hypothetical protein